MAPSIPISTQSGMFHTFRGVPPRIPSAESGEGPSAGGNGAPKRITIQHACSECKRRKIRCDGRQPCGPCLSSRAPKTCLYERHRQRLVPSRKTLEALSQSLEEYRSILRRLYPNRDIQSLLPLSRQELLEALEHPASDGINALLSPSSAGVESPVPGSNEQNSCLEQIPGRDVEWDEERRGRDPIPPEADDVNALSLASVDRPASYLGGCSIKVALMVMLKVQPGLRNYLSPPMNSSEITPTMPFLRHRVADPKETQRIPWSYKGQTLIDAYFKRVHMFIPMLDEALFRADFLEGQRSDAPWLALLNMVFAMGSIAATKSDDHDHFNYYTRAMGYLPMDSLASSHLETVQALGIIGGYYLHYINMPNMANAILGAALRMASALGLHRETVGRTPKASNNEIAAAECRRRTWWTLVCLDTWATTTTGRPSFGRWGSAINVRIPEAGVATGRDSAQHAGILPLIENIRFCKIATGIQDILAATPVLLAKDRDRLDQELVKWYNGLPWLLRTTEPCAESLSLARCVMKWRYQNLRLLLHRPVLLNLASSGKGPGVEQDIAAIETCRRIAEEAIDSIAQEWSVPCLSQWSGWPAVWDLYQVAMVPLVSLFWQWNSPQVPNWQKQIEKILDLLEAMRDWSLSASRTREVVSRMYEASRQLKPDTRMLNPQPTANTSEARIAPPGLELEEFGSVDMSDLSGPWDLDGMLWGATEGIEYAPWGNFDDGMMATNGLWFDGR